MSHFSQSCRHLSTSTHQVAARQVRGVSPHYRPTLEANDHFLEGVPRHDTLSSLHSSSYASQKQVIFGFTTYPAEMFVFIRLLGYERV